MPVEEAKYHMKRCVDSGLWVPNAADANDDDSEKSKEASEKTEDSAKSNEMDKEPVYTGVSSNDLD